jgi:hypothetical protein
MAAAFRRLPCSVRWLCWAAFPWGLEPEQRRQRRAFFFIVMRSGCAIVVQGRGTFFFIVMRSGCAIVVQGRGTCLCHVHRTLEIVDD